MLHSCKPACQNLDLKILPVDAIIIGSKLWSLCLFQMEEGAHSVQVKSQVSSGMSALHAIVVSTVK